MQIIKLLTPDTLPFLNDFEGRVFNLPSEKDSLDNLELPEVANESFYIIEAAPDTSNPLNYDGVNIALKIYFQAISNNVNNFKIILVGYEDKACFFQFCSYSNILKCPGIDYLEIGHDSSEKINNLDLLNIDLNNAKQSILNIGIKPPSSYKSHHSIANEWAILRWAKALKIDNDNLSKTQMEVDSNLYYNYLNTIYPITNEINITNRVLLHKGHILFIDDEVEKGWGLIFKKICANSKLELFGREFKKWMPETIINESFEKAKNADIVILDMRLHEDDFNQEDITKITSYQILEKIKEHNGGIQVIIFSASNKIWNLQALQKIGADGFIVKESPENSVDKKFTPQSISDIYKTIDSCLDYAFVKGFYEIFLMLKQNLERRKKKKELPKEFVDEYLKWLEFGINNLLKYKSNEGNVLTFVMFFSVLENISNRLIGVDNPEPTSGGMFKFKFRRNNNYLVNFDWNQKSKSYNKTTNDLVCNRSISWNQKVLNTLDVLECDLPNINYLVKKRNDIIHSNSTTGDKIQISNEDLKRLFKSITEKIENIS